jgi:hypothetical protein
MTTMSNASMALATTTTNSTINVAITLDNSAEVTECMQLCRGMEHSCNHRFASQFYHS